MFAIFVERSDARQGAVIPFVVLQKSVARVIHEYLLATPVPVSTIAGKGKGKG